MKLLYVTYYDTTNVREWSGIPFHMLEAAREVFEEVEVLGPYEVPFRLVNRLMFRFCRDVLRTGYVRETQDSFLKDYAGRVESELRGRSGDLIFADSIFPIAELTTTIPIVAWGDATVKCLREHYYPMQKDLGFSRRATEKTQEKAIRNTKLFVYASQWAAHSAIEDYGADAKNVSVIPFGANLKKIPDRKVVEAKILSKQLNPCKLLLIGVDWERKGVDLAVEVARKLHEEGVLVELTIVGCLPAAKTDLPDYVKVTGFLDKQSEKGAEAFYRMLAESTFMLFPSRAEAFGIVACEASAFGVPTLSSNVGGIESAVRNGKNGFAFSLEKYVVEASEKILELLQNPDGYRELAFESRLEYESELNWKKGFSKIRERVEKISDKE